MTKAGIPVTSVARTLLDVAHTQPGQLPRAIDEAERLGLLLPSRIERLSTRCGGHPGLGRFRYALREYCRPLPFTRSELERRLYQHCLDAGLPPPRMNVVIAGIEVDAAWREARLIVELDGYAFHRTRARFEDDRRRDATLQRAGYRVVRFTYRQVVEQPEWVLETIRSLVGDRGGRTV